MGSVLEFQNISKYFPGVKALDQVSFQAHSGEVLAFLGENGAGKSTLLKVLNGDYQPTSGKYLLDGVEKHFQSPHEAIEEGISVIYQERQILLELSVAENIYLGRMPAGRFGFIDTRKANEDAAAIIRDFGLPIDPAAKVKDLSIAWQQMVEIMKAYSRENLKDAPNVKLICEFATGYDNIDLAYCKSQGIKVANVVNYSTDAVAQHTFALCFYVLEKLRHYDEYVKSGAYAAQDRFSNFDIPFTELAGKTWGIVGMGNIGRKVASIACAFGCKVIFYSASGQSTCTEYERVDFDTLLKESDFLSLHCPLSDKTRDLINLDALKRMKKSAILINVARGPVVTDNDLYTALTENIIAGAGLDVISAEPIRKDNPLGNIMDSNKLIVTPHLAWASIEARNRCVSETCRNIEAFLKGENRNIVNP